MRTLRTTQLPDTALFLMPHDGHPAPTGDRIAACHLAEYVIRSQLLAGSCSGKSSDVAVH